MAAILVNYVVWKQIIQCVDTSVRMYVANYLDVKSTCVKRNAIQDYVHLVPWKRSRNVTVAMMSRPCLVVVALV